MPNYLQNMFKNRLSKESARQKRDLQFEVSFLKGLVRRAPDYTEAIEVLAYDLTKLGKYEEALKYDELLVKLLPNDPTARYNLACSYSLTHKYEKAVEAIEKAIDLGFNDFKLLRRDPDLKNLRRHILFKRVKEKIRLARQSKK